MDTQNIFPLWGVCLQNEYVTWRNTQPYLYFQNNFQGKVW